MIALPTRFVAMMTDLLGVDECNALCTALNEDAPTSVRLSQRRPGTHSTIIEPEGLKVVPWCPWGRYLSSRPPFTADPAWHSGTYYVQEASSMLLYAIQPLLGDHPIVALDLCAAPGGKSTLLSDLLPEGSVLVSNEIVTSRAHILTENMQKWGAPTSVVTSTPPNRLGRLRHAFDFILVDAPCSGEGMFRKDLKARDEWTPDAPALCATRQREILTDIWSALAPGGMMVYSTCTFNRQENEDIAIFIIEELGAEPLSLEPLDGSIIRSSLVAYPCYRMMPHRTRGEGLFLCALRKLPDDTAPNRKSRIRTATKAEHHQIPQELFSWVRTPSEYNWVRTPSDEVYAYTSAVASIISRLTEERIPILTAGIPVAVIKGKSLIPHHALAYSTERNKETFGTCELSPNEVIPYLSRETITLSPELSPGIKLLTYKGNPLGFAKHLGNRTNSLYPTHWRIRHSARVGDSFAEYQ